MLSRSFVSLMLLSGLILPQQGGKAGRGQASEAPSYTPDKQLRFPSNYREWVYLTSGVDMSYDPKEQAADHSMFGNVFVNPSSYGEFLNSGTWPDKTTILIENRSAVHGAASDASLNKRGLTQSEETMGMEVHVKDASLPGGWGFYVFDNMTSAKLIARPASCYTCHEQHAAVDTTFAQFYPTLFPVAKAKGTISKDYLAEFPQPAK